jgi:hypothetical protein
METLAIKNLHRRVRSETRPRIGTISQIVLRPSVHKEASSNLSLWSAAESAKAATPALSRRAVALSEGGFFTLPPTLGPLV